MRWFPGVHLIVYSIISTVIIDLEARSRWRTLEPLMPELITCWAGENKVTHHLKDHYLELHPLFSKFDRDYFMSHLLPRGPIPYRIEEGKSVDGATLKKLAESVVKELLQKKTTFTHFTTIKKSNFNERLSSGLIILKYNDYPFVLKLFIKTPETFIKQREGVVPIFFYRMGGGINRHLSGFTRVKNLEEIKRK